MMKKQPCVPGGNPHPASPGAPFKRSLLVGSCHLSSIQTKPKQAKLYQSKLCQAKPWQAPTSPLPTYFLDGVEPIRVQKPKHPNPPPTNSATPEPRSGRYLRPGLPTVGGRKHQGISGEYFTAREACQARPRCFFPSAFFLKKSGQQPPARCGGGDNVTVRLYANKGASFLRNIGCSGRCPDPAGTLSLHSARGSASELRHLLKKVDENFNLHHWSEQ